MKLPVASVVLPLLFPAGGSGAQPSADRAACIGAEMTSDQMGVRARDADGNWRYITQEDFVFIEAARFSGMPSLYVRALGVQQMSRKFGACGESYIRLAAATGIASRDEAGGFAPGQIVQLWQGLGGPPPTAFQPQGTNLMALYATGGTDLIRYRNHYYAIHQGSACAIAPPEMLGGLGSARRAVAAPCTPETRAQLTGVVRRIADSLAEIGVERVERAELRYESTRLHARIRVRTASGRQELQFAEE